MELLLKWIEKVNLNATDKPFRKKICCSVFSKNFLDEAAHENAQRRQLSCHVGEHPSG
jgi:hypothetical protein